MSADRRGSSFVGLQGKLTAIITLPMAGVVTIMLVFFAANHVRHIEASLVHSTRSMIRALNQDLERLYLGQEQQLSADMVDRLQSFSDVRRVCAFANDGQVFFAFFAKDVPAAAPPESGDATELVGDTLAVRQPLTSGERRVGTVYFEVSAEQLHSAQRNWIMLVASVGAVVLASGGLTGIFLQRIISRPILELMTTAAAVSSHRDFGVRARKLSNDEIGDLAEAFNGMLVQIQSSDEQLRLANRDLEQRVEQRTAELGDLIDQLEREIDEHKQTQQEREHLYKDLMVASRQAGMSDVATGVLHNVGNVLNSVNVTATILRERLRDAQVDGLLKACALIDENAGRIGEFFEHDEKGKKLLGYLRLLAEKMVADRDATMLEIRGLVENIEHIKEIVNLQQSFGRTFAMRETVSLPELMENALKINYAGLNRHGVEVVREYEDVPEIVTDKHKMLQILVNLVSNAKYAAGAILQNDRRIWLRIRRADGDRIEVQVADNGVGIAPENMTKIFTHGFTTKKDGHGFGLHSAALAAKELGGSIRAASDGPGQGATFTVEVPMVMEGRAVGDWPALPDVGQLVTSS